MVFTDHKKAYDKVPRNLIWQVLDKRSVPRGYIEIIKDMYRGALTTIRTTYERIGKFLATIIGGSTLSSYLFTPRIVELTTHIQEEVPWCMFFANESVGG